MRELPAALGVQDGRLSAWTRSAWEVMGSAWEVMGRLPRTGLAERMIRGVMAPGPERQSSTGTTIRTTIAQADFDELKRVADEECTTVSALVRGFIRRELRRRRTLQPEIA